MGTDLAFCWPFRSVKNTWAGRPCHSIPQTHGLAARATRQIGSRRYASFSNTAASSRNFAASWPVVESSSNERAIANNSALAR